MCSYFMKRVASVGLLGAFFIGGCEKAQTQVATPPPPPVNVVVPVQRQVQEYDEFIGRVAATQSVDIRSRVAGYIVKIGFEDGAEVKQGQVLFEIDPEPFKAALDQARSKLMQAQAEQDYANRELARIEPLAKTGGASQLELSKAQDMVARSKASIAGGTADVEARQLDLDYASVKAPIDGRASKSLFTVGNLIGGDTLLTNVVSMHPIYVNVDVDEQRFLVYREIGRKMGTTNPSRFRDVNLPLFVALANEKDFPHKGVIEFVDNRVDPLTGTIRVRAEFDNTSRVLVPGQFVRARVPRGDPSEQLLVPDRAVGRDQDRKYLLVVDDKNMVEYRSVETGGLFGDDRVISTGLKAGERVVVDGMQRARPGQPVVPTVAQPSTQPTAQAR